MIRIGYKAIWLSVPVIVLAIGLCVVHTVKRQAGFTCKTNVFHLDSQDSDNINDTLHISLSFKGDGEGYFDLYGFFDKGPKQSTVFKLARRLYFTYDKRSGVYYINMGRTIKFNNDSADLSSLPEFISSPAPILHIEKMKSNNYIVYDQVSPALICSKVD